MGAGAKKTHDRGQAVQQTNAEKGHAVSFEHQTDLQTASSTSPTSIIPCVSEE